MAVISVRNLDKATLQTNEHGQPTHTLMFQVTTDSLFDGPLIAEAALPVSIGDYYVYGGVVDYRAVCTGATTNTIERYQKGDVNGFVYESTVTYSQLENSQVPNNPLASPAEQSFSVENQEAIADFEIDSGNAITNSALCPYDPPLTRNVAKGRFTVNQNEAAFNFGLLNYVNTTNSDVFLGYPAGTVLCAGVGFTGPNFQDDVTYYKITYEFLIDPNGFEAEILDVGTMEFDSGTPIKLQNIKVKGESVSSPVPLNGNGRALPANGIPVKRTHKIYASLPFGGAFEFRS